MPRGDCRQTLYSILNSPVNAADRQQNTEGFRLLSRTLALGDATQVTRVAEHIIQRDLSDGRELIFANLTVRDRAPSLVQPSNNSTWK